MDGENNIQERFEATFKRVKERLEKEGKIFEPIKVEVILYDEKNNLNLRNFSTLSELALLNKVDEAELNLDGCSGAIQLNLDGCSGAIQLNLDGCSGAIQLNLDGCSGEVNLSLSAQNFPKKEGEKDLNLTSLSLNNCVNLKVLNVEGCVNLKELKLNNCNLNILNLNRCCLDKLELKKKCDLKRLEMRDCSDCSFIDNSLKFLKDCKNLEWLDIRNSKTITRGLEYVPTAKLKYFLRDSTIFQKQLALYLRGDDNAGECVKRWQADQKSTLGWDARQRDAEIKKSFLEELKEEEVSHRSKAKIDNQIYEIDTGITVIQEIISEFSRNLKKHRKIYLWTTAILLILTLLRWSSQKKIKPKIRKTD